MVKTFALLTLAVLTIGALTPVQGHALTLARPEIGEKREFREGPPHEIVELRSSRASWRAVAFTEALDSCALTPQRAQALLDQALSATPFKALSDIVGPHAASLERLPITIAIDSFSEGRLKFGSYHLPDYPEAGSHYIALDCHPVARAYWKNSLAHELTHALNWRLGIPSWADEMAAQLVDDAAGGTLPLKSVGNLSAAESIPFLFDTGRPFANATTNGLVFLFGQYLSHVGGRELVQAFLGYRTHPSCTQSDFYEAAVCRAHAQLQSRDGQWDFAEKMTPKGLLRHFAVALTLNHRAERFYFIPFWSGFLGPMPVLTLAPRLAPGEFQRYATTGFNLQTIPEGYEVYLVRRRIKDFEILSRKELSKGPVPAASEPSDEFYLVINSELSSESSNGSTRSPDAAKSGPAAPSTRP